MPRLTQYGWVPKGVVPSEEAARLHEWHVLMEPLTNLDLQAQANAYHERQRAVRDAQAEATERWLRGVEYRNSVNAAQRERAAAEVEAHKPRKLSHAEFIAECLS